MASRVETMALAPLRGVWGLSLILTATGGRSHCPPPSGSSSVFSPSVHRSGQSYFGEICGEANLDKHLLGLFISALATDEEIYFKRIYFGGGAKRKSPQL